MNQIQIMKAIMILNPERNLTCAPCHIQFIRDRKNSDKHYRTLVRMAKRWKNFENPPGLKSFHIELILAYLQDRDGPTENIEQRFREFFVGFGCSKQIK